MQNEHLGYQRSAAERRSNGRDGKRRRSPALPGLRFNGRLINCFSLNFLTTAVHCFLSLFCFFLTTICRWLKCRKSKTGNDCCTTMTISSLLVLPLKLYYLFSSLVGSCSYFILFGRLHDFGAEATERLPLYRVLY